MFTRSSVPPEIHVYPETWSVTLLGSRVLPMWLVKTRSYWTEVAPHPMIGVLRRGRRPREASESMLIHLLTRPGQVQQRPRPAPGTSIFWPVRHPQTTPEVTPGFLRSGFAIIAAAKSGCRVERGRMQARPPVMVPSRQQRSPPLGQECFSTRKQEQFM